MQRITAKGYIETFTTWEEVKRHWPDALASKIALLVKDKPDGSRKSRIIIDLLRSGVNSDVTNPERVVLPRVSDYTESIIDLQSAEP